MLESTFLEDWDETGTKMGLQAVSCGLMRKPGVLQDLGGSVFLQGSCWGQVFVCVVICWDTGRFCSRPFRPSW